MSFRKNDGGEQISLYHRGPGLTAQEREAVENSWAQTFAETIFPCIDGGIFEPMYGDSARSRPNMPVNVTMGALIIQEMFGITDGQLAENVNGNYLYQVALHTADDERQPFSKSCFAKFRRKCLEYRRSNGVDLMHWCMEPINRKVAALMTPDFEALRAGQEAGQGDRKRLSRPSGIYLCIAALVEALRAEGTRELPGELEPYFDYGFLDCTFLTLDRNRAEGLRGAMYEACDILLDLCGSTCDGMPEYENFLFCLGERAVS